MAADAAPLPMRCVAPDATFTNWIRKIWSLQLRAMSQMASQALLTTRSVTHCGEWDGLATREVAHKLQLHKMSAQRAPSSFRVAGNSLAGSGVVKCKVLQLRLLGASRAPTSLNLYSGGLHSHRCKIVIASSILLACSSHMKQSSAL